MDADGQFLLPRLMVLLHLRLYALQVFSGFGVFRVETKRALKVGSCLDQISLDGERSA